MKEDNNANTFCLHETYIDTDGHEKCKTKEIEIPNILLGKSIFVTKNDWKTKDMPIQFEEFVLNKKLNNIDIIKISEGYIPKTSEDKWFWYVDDNKAYFHESRTGFCIYIVDLNKSGKLKVRVNRAKEQYDENNIDNDKRIINDLIDYIIERY